MKYRSKNGDIKKVEFKVVTFEKGKAQSKSHRDNQITKAGIKAIIRESYSK